MLEVPGARLYYETRGDGPLLLMVPGGNGEADIFAPVAECLAADFTVATYDRRGFSRSELDGPQDYDNRLRTDVEDVRRLIEHLSDEPATIFGTSSGGVVVLETVTHHPAAVAKVVAHEPAAVRQLPDGQEWVDACNEVYDLYRQSGPQAAFMTFTERMLPAADREHMARATNPEQSEYVAANSTYWFEHELRQYPAVELDLDVLGSHAERLVLLAGRESRGCPAYEVNVELAKKLGRELIEVPGGHGGYVSDRDEFARELVRALAPRSRMSSR